MNVFQMVFELDFFRKIFAANMTMELFVAGCFGFASLFMGLLSIFICVLGSHVVLQIEQLLCGKHAQVAFELATFTFGFMFDLLHVGLKLAATFWATNIALRWMLGFHMAGQSILPCKRLRTNVTLESSLSLASVGSNVSREIWFDRCSIVALCPFVDDLLAAAVHLNMMCFVLCRWCECFGAIWTLE